MKKRIIEELYLMGACNPAVEWVTEQENPLAAWESCRDPSWLAWLVQNMFVLSSDESIRLHLAMLETPLTNSRKVIDFVESHDAHTLIDMIRNKLDGQKVDVSEMGMFAYKVRNEKMPDTGNETDERYDLYRITYYANQSVATNPRHTLFQYGKISHVVCHNANVYAFQKSTNSVEERFRIRVEISEKAQEWQVNKIREIIPFEECLKRYQL